MKVMIFSKVNIDTKATIIEVWKEFLNDPVRLQDNHGNDKIIKEVERKGQHQMPKKMNKELRVYTYILRWCLLP